MFFGLSSSSKGGSKGGKGSSSKKSSKSSSSTSSKSSSSSSGKKGSSSKSKFSSHRVAVSAEPVPEITFGVELEFVLCIKRTAVPRDATEEYFHWATTRLNAQPALSNRVSNSLALGRSIQYNSWNLIADSSTSGRPDWGASLHGMSEMDARYSYGCQGMELVSPVFRYNGDNNYFESKLNAIKDAFRGKAFNNDSTGLHIHLGIPVSSHDPLASGLTLEVLRVLFLLWATNEGVIESLQPSHRHGHNYYVESLLSKITREHPEITTRRDKLMLMARQLQQCTSRQHIIRDVVGGTPGNAYKKLNISFETTRKPTTIEFREHFGTLAKRDILQWVKFCRKMLLFAYQNRNRVWTNDWLVSLFDQSGTLSRLITLLGIGAGDGGYLRDRRIRVVNGNYDHVVNCQ